MKRKDFFKTLFGVTAAAVVAPHVFKEEPEEVERNNYAITREFDGKINSIDVYKGDWSDSVRLAHEGYTPEELLKIWKETGMLIYQV